MTPAGERAVKVTLMGRHGEFVEHESLRSAETVLARPTSSSSTPGVQSQAGSHAFDELVEAQQHYCDEAGVGAPTYAGAWSGLQLYVAEDCQRLLELAIKAGEEVVTITVDQLAALLDMANRVSKWGLV